LRWNQRRRADGYSIAAMRSVDALARRRMADSVVVSIIDLSVCVVVFARAKGVYEGGIGGLMCLGANVGSGG